MADIWTADGNVRSAVNNSKVLVVGAGGIGCELLKNLVLSGFKNIAIIDLDTIDVSNLNRQFLFQKQHVGKSKATVARESALRFNPAASIKAYPDSITSSDYGMSFFKQFTFVMNALDNRSARNHVNRMCLAADIPLIESGTAGYTGQVEVIKKGLTQCYECMPKPPQKSFPGCTIRNTPSEPIHCIVWGKHLFNQLFGEEDPDEDVSPDTADPEATGDAGEQALHKGANAMGNVERISTRAWAHSCKYNPEKLFHKLFHDDIKYLLSMHLLWKTRRAPTPITWGDLPDAVPSSSKSENEKGLKDQRIWSLAECAEVFAETCKSLKNRLQSLQTGDHLVWDKDDMSSMDFVTACANIRSSIFGIPQKSRFDVKSMAGNIIPAIATTNAIVAGIIVLHAFKILQKKIEDCKTVYLAVKPNPRKQLIVPEKQLITPNEKCYVCSPKPEVTLRMDANKMTVHNLEEQVLKRSLNMVAPDVIIDDNQSMLISSDEGETSDNNSKYLAEFGIKDGSILKCDDFVQNYQLIVKVLQREAPKNGPEFEVIADRSQLMPRNPEEMASNGSVKGSVSDDDVEEDDDLILCEEEDADTPGGSESCPSKRKGSDPEFQPSKKPRVDADEELEPSNKPRMDADDVVIL